MSFWSGLFPPRWDWLQLEVTGRCNAACVYCPRTRYTARWRGRDMGPEVFQRLVPEFRHARMVHLQGWGEPLLHPSFFDLLAAVKRAGKAAGTTTNGTLVTPETAERLVASGLDLLAVSLAGPDARQDRIRVGAPLDAAVNALRLVREAKARLGSSSPLLHIAYMLFRSRIPDLSRLPGLLGGLGVSQVMVSGLDCLCAEDLAREPLRPEDHGAAESALGSLAAAAAPLGISVSWRIPRPDGRRGACTENVARAVVVGADGGVHPCVFGGLPLARDAGGEPGLLPPPPELTFGNVRESALSAIWDSAAYRDFRRVHGRGDPPPACSTCARPGLG